jgi:alkyl hydroperoxide reductase subunit AhpC
MRHVSGERAGGGPAQEIGEIVKRIDEFTARNTKVLGVSIGPAELHRRFADDIAETVGGVVPTPILADVDGAMCRRLGSVHPSLPGTGGGAHSVRSVLIFAPPDGGERDYEDVMAGDAPGSQGDAGADADGDADAHRRRRRRPRNWGSRALVLAMHYPPTVGRSWTEVVRAIDSLRTSEAEPSVGTPAGWVAGEDVVVLPTVSDDEARARLPGGFRSVRPYLRLAPDPTQ